MHIAVRVEPGVPDATDVIYRWDPDTDILTANMPAAAASDGMSGSVGIEGSDGSWLVFDVNRGRIRSVEVAVWPPVRKRSELHAPGNAEAAQVTVPLPSSRAEVAAIEIDTLLGAESSADRRVIHFTVGRPRLTRPVRIARDVLLDIDSQSRLAGVWLLNVPPNTGSQ